MDAVARLLLDPEPLTPAMLGLPDQDALEARIGAYLSIAGAAEGDDPTEPQRQRALALIYSARIVTLEGEVEKFRREGKITIERDLLSRIARLERLRDAATLAAQPPADSGDSGDLGPYIGAWGVG